jgi:hypothetical protein
MAHSLRFTGDQWLLCLQAADRWDAPCLRTLALQGIHTSSPAARISAVLRFGLDGLLDAAVVDICKAELDVDGLNLLPSKVLGEIFKARELLSKNNASDNLRTIGLDGAYQLRHFIESQRRLTSPS